MKLGSVVHFFSLLSFFCFTDYFGDDGRTSGGSEERRKDGKYYETPLG